VAQNSGVLLRMNIKTIPISEIQRAKYNPRKALKPGDPAYDKLKKAVETFGLVEPLVWNQRTGNLVGGHQRLSILEERGDSQVEVSVVDLNEREEKALNLALNKHSGEWDFASLADMLQELDAGDLDMEITGFDHAELERLMTWTAPNAGLTDEDAVPEPPVEPITKPGDLWILGRHRLMCADATKHSDVERLMNGEKAELFATDPPYLVDYDGMNHPSKIGDNPKKNKDWSGSYHEWDSSQGDGRQFYLDFYRVAVDVAIAKNAAWYCWHASRRQGMLESVWEEVGAFVHQQIIWFKSRPVLTYSVYMWAHEPCFFGWARGSKPRVIKQDNYPATVWNIPSAEVESADHPTSKPVRIFSLPMELHTDPGDVCFEPFSGSGSQFIAAEQLGRRCYGLEISPQYCDVIVQRFENFSGKRAELSK